LFSDNEIGSKLKTIDEKSRQDSNECCKFGTSSSKIRQRIVEEKESQM